MVQNGITRVSFYFCSTDPSSEFISLPQKGLERNSVSLLLFLFHRTKFQVVFSSAEVFGTEFREFPSIFVPRIGIPICFLFLWRVRKEFWELASILVPRNGIPSCFLFRWRVRKGIRRVCFYFCSTERNSELFSLPWKSLEQNSESFLFCGTARIPSEITTCFVYSVFLGIIRKLPTLVRFKATKTLFYWHADYALAFIWSFWEIKSLYKVCRRVA